MRSQNVMKPYEPNHMGNGIQGMSLGVFGGTGMSGKGGLHHLTSSI